MPTNLKLLNRGIVTAEASLYTVGCGHVELAKHLFLSCRTYGSQWQSVRSWLGILGVDPRSITYHFIQFIHFDDGLKARHYFLQLVWLLCVWIVWNERNGRFFRNLENTILQLLEKVKYLSLWWLKANKANFVYGSQ